MVLEELAQFSLSDGHLVIAALIVFDSNHDSNALTQLNAALKYANHMDLNSMEASRFQVGIEGYVWKVQTPWWRMESMRTNSS